MQEGKAQNIHASRVTRLASLRLDSLRGCLYAGIVPEQARVVESSLRRGASS